LPQFTLLLGVAACGRGPGWVPPADLPWRPFYWARVTSDSARFDRAAILLEVPLGRGGSASLVQLDLAASGTMPEGFPLPAGMRLAPALRRGGQLYGLLAGEAHVAMTRSAADSLGEDLASREIGTLGLANFESKALLLDLVRRRLAEVPSPTDLSTLLGPRTVTVPIEYPGDRVVLVLEGPSGRRYRAVLDTGLSPFPLWATRELWQDLTGLSGEGPRTSKFVLTGARGRLVFVTAAARQALRVGAWSFRPREVAYLAEGPAGAGLEDWPQPVDAVLGPATLAPDGLVALDLAHRRIGVVR
jgi:hypothetical protein